MSRESFEAALARAKRRNQPVIALRPDGRFPEELDDIVVKDVETFRAEAMDDNVWWMCCYFRDGERLTFYVTRDKKPSRIVITATEEPSNYLDWDDLHSEHRDDLYPRA